MEDLDAGIPVQLTLYGHQVVVIGYKYEDDDCYLYVNRGYSGEEDGWYKFTADTESPTLGSWGVLYAWVGLRPKKMVQLDPLPKVVGTSPTLSWALPDCWTNSVTAFQVKVKGTDETMVYAANSTARSYALTLKEGESYTFSVTPFIENVPGEESAAFSVTVDSTRTMGIPEISVVEHRGMSLDGRSLISVSADHPIVDLKATVGHTARLPNDRITAKRLKDGSWGVIVSPDPDRSEKIRLYDSMILTLEATDANGSKAYKDVVLYFNNANDDENAINALEYWTEPSKTPFKLFLR